MDEEPTVGIGMWFPLDPGEVIVVSCSAPDVLCVERGECFARSVGMREVCQGKVEFRVPD